MVRTLVTAKFPNLTLEDIGLFTNDEDLILTDDLPFGDTILKVDDAAPYDVGMWVPIRGLNGLEICQVTAVQLVPPRVTVARGQDGTVPINHFIGERGLVTIPAKAMNQIVAELLKIQDTVTVVVGEVPETYTEEYILTGISDGGNEEELFIGGTTNRVIVPAGYVAYVDASFTAATLEPTVRASAWDVKNVFINNTGILEQPLGPDVNLVIYRENPAWAVRLSHAATALRFIVIADIGAPQIRWTARARITFVKGGS